MMIDGLSHDGRLAVVGVPHRFTNDGHACSAVAPTATTTAALRTARIGTEVPKFARQLGVELVVEAH